MSKLRIHCPYRYKECLELGCPRDRLDLEERRILSQDPFTFCHRANKFYNERIENELYGEGEWVQKNGEWIRS